MYKIVCNDLNVTECYVGSTSDFTRRKATHKHLSKTSDLKVYKKIRDNGEWSNWSMIEIEKYPCNDANEAKARERYHYEKLNSQLNIKIPNRKKWECKDEMKQYHKDYYVNNKESIINKMTEKVHCEQCNIYLPKCHLKRHRRSLKHKTFETFEVVELEQDQQGD
jgi:hypothetical protein